MRGLVSDMLSRRFIGTSTEAHGSPSRRRGTPRGSMKSPTNHFKVPFKPLKSNRFLESLLAYPFCGTVNGLTASRRARDRRGRRRSAAIPPNQMWTKRCNISQDLTKCGNICALKTIVARCMEFVTLLRRPCLSRPRMEAGDLSRAW